jgi:hypothetical protein
MDAALAVGSVVLDLVEIVAQAIVAQETVAQETVDQATRLQAVVVVGLAKNEAVSIEVRGQAVVPEARKIVRRPKTGLKAIANQTAKSELNLNCFVNAPGRWLTKQMVDEVLKFVACRAPLEKVGLCIFSNGFGPLHSVLMRKTGPTGVRSQTECKGPNRFYFPPASACSNS